MDSKNSKIIFDILKEISKEHLVIVVSHDENAANYYADRIITIEDGKIVSDVSKQQLLITNELFDNIKIRQYNKWLTRHIFKFFFYRKEKIIPSTIMITISLLSVAFIIGMIIVNHLDEECVKEINNKDYVAESINYSPIKVTITTDSAEISTVCEVIDTTDFYIDRYSYIDGNMISDENEIIIEKKLLIYYLVKRVQLEKV